MQFHVEVPIKAAILGVVACPQVLPDPVIPGFRYEDGGWLRLHPRLEYPSQLIPLLELHKHTVGQEIFRVATDLHIFMPTGTLRDVVFRQECVGVSSVPVTDWERFDATHFSVSSVCARISLFPKISKKISAFSERQNDKILKLNFNWADTLTEEVPMYHCFPCSAAASVPGTAAAAVWPPPPCCSPPPTPAKQNRVLFANLQKLCTDRARQSFFYFYFSKWSLTCRFSLSCKPAMLFRMCRGSPLPTSNTLASSSGLTGPERNTDIFFFLWTYLISKESVSSILHKYLILLLESFYFISTAQ